MTCRDVWARVFRILLLALCVAKVGSDRSDCPEEAGEDFASVRKFAVGLHNQVQVTATLARSDALLDLLVCFSALSCFSAWIPSSSSRFFTIQICVRGAARCGSLDCMSFSKLCLPPSSDLISRELACEGHGAEQIQTRVLPTGASAGGSVPDPCHFGGVIIALFIYPECQKLQKFYCIRGSNDITALSCRVCCKQQKTVT